MYRFSNDVRNHGRIAGLLAVGLLTSIDCDSGSAGLAQSRDIGATGIAQQSLIETNAGSPRAVAQYSTEAAPPAISPPGQPSAQSWEEWRQAMSKTLLPRKGCFQASHPSTSWQEVPCGTAPPHFPALPRAPHLSSRGSGAFMVGDGIEDNAMVSGTMASAVGSFPTVTGVGSVKSVYPPNNTVASNAYSVQLNTNSFTTAACNGVVGCLGIQQFVYANSGSSAQILIQSWLMNYGSECPTPGSPPYWGGDGSGNCVATAYSSQAPSVLSITKLANLVLTAASVAGGNDQASVSMGSGSPIAAVASDSVLNLAGHWNEADFNVLGNGDISEAVFTTASGYSGVTIVGKISLSTGTTASPTCTGADPVYTEETNNLNLVPSSCCASGGTSPAIQFIESNATPLPTPPFCLLNDIVPILSSL